MTTIGILGGGQLARMMIQARGAANLPMRLRVLTPRSSDPAGRLAGAELLQEDLVLGDPRDPESLRAFLASVDVACFESEFQPADQLRAASAGLAVEFRPSLNALATTQDKLEQKALYRRFEIPTSPWIELTASAGRSGRAALAFLQEREAREAVGEAPVLKWARLGYDGKGTFFCAVEPAADEEERLDRFLAAAAERETPVFAERRVDFVRELAIVVSASRGGELCEYPLVISEQQHGICKRVYGPAVALGVDPAREEEARAAARRIAERLPLEGSFALELFETVDGALLVNEMAPRVHNSGHYSIDACHCSQFENHLRAVGGLALGSPALRERCFAMLNLLGDRRRRDPPRPQLPLDPKLIDHWYEKDESRPGRKLGHLNALAADEGALRTTLAALDRADEAWLQRLASRDVSA